MREYYDVWRINEGQSIPIPYSTLAYIKLTIQINSINQTIGENCC